MSLQRAWRARKNYGRNALGKFVRKKAFRECDYTPEGHLRQFDDEAGFIAFEEEPYTSGQHQAHYNTKVRSTVPKEQLALDYIAVAAVAPAAEQRRQSTTRAAEIGSVEAHNDSFRARVYMANGNQFGPTRS